MSKTRVIRLYTGTSIVTTLPRLKHWVSLFKPIPMYILPT